MFLHPCPSQANDVRRANPGAAALYEWALARPGKWLKSILLRLLKCKFDEVPLSADTSID